MKRRRFGGTGSRPTRGSWDAQLNLGSMYEEGRGVPQDETEAVRWYRLAADQGYAPAQHNLGVAYENGRGVPQDYAEAVRWYRLAAEQEYADAQVNLGVSYRAGRGVPQGRDGGSSVVAARRGPGVRARPGQPRGHLFVRPRRPAG